MAPRSTSIFNYVLLIFFAAAAFAVVPACSAALAPEDTCVPSLQRMLSCLDFIEHRSDEIPLPCCIQVKAAIEEQPCCLMHVLRGNVAKLLGPEYDNRRAMVDVTTKCLGDASVLMNIGRNCSGKPLPPLTPEFTFTTTSVPPPPPSSSGATSLLRSSLTVSFLAFLAFILLRST